MPVVRGGTLIRGDTVRRFWSKTKVEGQCVVWVGAKDKDGYGKFTTNRPGEKQRHHRAHRWLYETCVGPIGERPLLHSCDNPACVSLQHLSPGDALQNRTEAVARGRVHGRPRVYLTEQQVKLIRQALDAGVPRDSLADWFGVHRSTIRAIATFRTWRHVK